MRYGSKQIVGLAVLTALLFSGGAAYANWPGQGFGAGRGRGGQPCPVAGERRAAFRDNMHAYLGLTEEQDALLTEKRDAHRAKMDELQAALQKKRADLREELGKTELDMKKIDALKSEIKVLYAQKVDHRVDGILGVREALTAEQFKKFQEFGKTRGAGRGPASMTTPPPPPPPPFGEED